MNNSSFLTITLVLTGWAGSSAIWSAQAEDFSTTYNAMVSGQAGWATQPVFTVGETIQDYQPAGLLDGLAAYPLDDQTVRVLSNHELGNTAGSAYTLANGTMLTGARISFYDLNRISRGLCGAGPAFDTVVDRSGQIVTSAAQINERGHPTAGFNRFCSSSGFQPGQYGFVDFIYFTGEETFNGTFWALDVANGVVWAAPELGRGAWENLTALDCGRDDLVALLMGDDTEGSPLYLYVGRKNALGDGSFLDRNGLALGDVYAWKASGNARTPDDFHGMGSVVAGHFVKLRARKLQKAGEAGYDSLGYLNSDLLAAQALQKNCFSFSRPEDLSTNPNDGTQAVFNSTGRGSLFPSDDWGTTYLVQLDFSDLEDIRATLTILHDGDDFPDLGIRSQDNAVWAKDGFIYINEDKSTGRFGSISGIEASVWKLDPVSLAIERIGVVDRTVVAPDGSTDPVPFDIGNWETSGLIEVTDLFETSPGETLLLFDVQAHSVRDGLIREANLVEGGQLLFISNASAETP